jgi:hypothetical protein
VFYTAGLGNVVISRCLLSFCPSLQMAGKVLVHLEHRHLVLAEDPSELIVASIREFGFTDLRRLVWRI